MPSPLKRGILGARTIILSKDIDKYAFMCGSNLYESDVIYWKSVCHIFENYPPCICKSRKCQNSKKNAEAFKVEICS